LSSQESDGIGTQLFTSQSRLCGQSCRSLHLPDLRRSCEGPSQEGRQADLEGCCLLTGVL